MGNLYEEEEEEGPMAVIGLSSSTVAFFVAVSTRDSFVVRVGFVGLKKISGVFASRNY